MTASDTRRGFLVLRGMKSRVRVVVVFTSCRGNEVHHRSEDEAAYRRGAQPLPLARRSL